MILDVIKATLNASSESLQKNHSANKQYPYLHLSREKIQFKKMIIWPKLWKSRENPSVESSSAALAQAGEQVMDT